MEKYFSICRFFKLNFTTKSTCWLVLLIFACNILSGCMLTGGMYQKLGSHERLTKKVKNVTIDGKIIKYNIIEDVYEKNEAINIHSSSVKTVEAKCEFDLERATILSETKKSIDQSDAFVFDIDTNSYKNLEYKNINVDLLCRDVMETGGEKSVKLNYGPPFTINDEYKKQINIKNTKYYSTQKYAEKIDSIIMLDETNGTIKIFRCNSLSCIREVESWWSAPVKLLLTPFTVVIDIVTFPIQILFIKKSLDKIT